MNTHAITAAEYWNVIQQIYIIIEGWTQNKNSMKDSYLHLK